MKYMDFYRHNESPMQFSFIIINDQKLYYPRITVRKEIRNQAEKYLRNNYLHGRYTDYKKINEILNYQFSFYNSKLQEIIPKLDLKNWLVYTIFQYEISGEIANKYKDQSLNNQDYNFWSKNGPTFRQAADLLCDKFVEFSGNSNEYEMDFEIELIYYDVVWICAENCVKYASLSNFIFMLTREESFIEILPPGNDIFLKDGNINQTDIDNCYNYYQNQTNQDIKLRKKYIEGIEYEHDVAKHISILDGPLKDYLGMSYSEILYLLTSISKSTRPITSPDKVPMVDKEIYFNEFSRQGGFSLDSIGRLFDAFTLTKEKLRNEPREAWNYKQKNRVSKKPFLEITYQGKKHLLWSDQKLKDFFTLLDLDVTFKNFPTELMNKEVSKAIDKNSNNAGKWFESQVILNMKKINILGSNVKRKIKSKLSHSEVLCQAGEIDFLGVSESDSAIVLLESKMINAGFEARSFRQDKDKFLKGDDSYFNKFTRKLNWVLDNFDYVKKILCENYGIDESKISRKVLSGFITYYTTLIPCFMDAYPCVSLVDFIEKYKYESKWPFSYGIVYLN